MEEGDRRQGMGSGNVWDSCEKLDSRWETQWKVDRNGNGSGRAAMAGRASVRVWENGRTSLLFNFVALCLHDHIFTPSPP